MLPNKEINVPLYVFAAFTVNNKLIIYLIF